MNMKLSRMFVLSLLALSMFAGCKDDEGTPVNDDTTTDPLEIYKKVYGASDVYLEGDFVVIHCTGVPDHPSPYFENTQWSDRFEAYNGSNPDWNQNPNEIVSFDVTRTSDPTSSTKEYLVVSCCALADKSEQRFAGVYTSSIVEFEYVYKEPINESAIQC